MPYLQYKQINMIQPTLLPFLKKRNQIRWTEAEFSNLLKTIEEIQPITVRDWRAVTKRMHELGPKRLTKCYKEKFNNYLDQKESQQIRKVPFITKNILKYFDQGKSPTQISELTKIGVFLVKKILKSTLIKIQRYIPRIIGKSMEKKIRFNDYHFFGYLHQQNLDLISLTKVENMCVHWNAIMKNTKNDYKINGPGLQEKTLEYIKRKLVQFNSNLNLYSSSFSEYLSSNKDLQKDLKKTDLTQNEIDYKSLFLASSRLIEQVDLSESESQILIQARCQVQQLQENKNKKIKAETCVSLTKQPLQHKKDCYKISDFKLKKQPIQHFLLTFDNYPDQENEIQPPMPIKKHFSCLQLMASEDECFFFGKDYNSECDQE